MVVMQPIPFKYVMKQINATHTTQFFTLSRYCRVALQINTQHTKKIGFDYKCHCRCNRLTKRDRVHNECRVTDPNQRKKIKSSQQE
mmetsp:Transcript_18772/g.24867  ORF Transcript_18772/g.24867 Transcript_18772/m.24867 type:complete len:86 (-) Transcript_18772:278-535(-)